MSHTKKSLTGYLVSYSDLDTFDYPYFNVTKPNEMHQFDLLYMTQNKLYRNTYK